MALFLIVALSLMLLIAVSQRNTAYAEIERLEQRGPFSEWIIATGILGYNECFALTDNGASSQNFYKLRNCKDTLKINE